MKNQVLFTAFLAISLFCFISSCADKLPDPADLVDDSLDCATSRITYVDHIKGILDAQCELSGCHDNNSQGTFGDFSTLGQARMEEIYTRVCVTKNMPPLGMDIQLVDSIRCWSENGYLEN